jgi:uncharacterized protein
MPRRRSGIEGQPIKALPPQSNLGAMYALGQGVPQDYVEAAKLFRKAADQGYDAAQYNLGTAYTDGQCVPQDYVQAYMWFTLAAARASDTENKNLAVKSRDLLLQK